MIETCYIPPQNLEAERAVLGGLLLDPEAILDLPAELTAEAFYLPSHGHIFQTMTALWDRGVPIDSVSIVAEARPRNWEMSLLADLSDHGMPRSNAYHAGLIIAAYRQRRTINLVREALQELYETPERHEEILRRLNEANDKALPSRAVHIRDVMVESLKRIEQAGETRALIPTGFTDLDKEIGGLERGELVVIGGRPGMGKTSIALNIGTNAAKLGFSVLIVSVETSRDKLGLRMLSRQTNINSRKFRTGALDNRERSRLIDAAGKLGELPVHMRDNEDNWENIKREIRRSARGGLDLVILDFLTLLDLPTGKNERRDLALGRVANEAKRLAQSLNLAFLLLSQLNRKTEDRSGGEPTVSDLRDSGDIEQAADLIVFPFRPIVYDPDFKPSDKAFLIVAKGRDLPTGKIPVRYSAEITSFSDWRERDWP